MKSVFLVVIGQFYIKERSLHKPNREMKQREGASERVCRSTIHRQFNEMTNSNKG